MKTNFNIRKNVRNSHFTRVLSVMEKLQSLGLIGIALILGSLQVWGDDEIGTITFGAPNDVKINAASVTGDDDLENTWTITTVGTTSFTNNNNSGYSQVGSSSKPATSITFTTTLSSVQTITSMSANFGGFSGTAGTITLKVGDTSVGTGSLNGASDVTVTNSSTGTGKVLTVTVTDISKGVKCYNISYTYSSGPTTYTVTYAAGGATGGSVPVDASSPYTLGSTVTVLGNTGSLVKAGFNFNGWLGDNEVGAKTAGQTFSMPAANVTLTAQWSAKTYSNYRTLCATTDPSLSVSPASLTGLDYIVGNGPSAAKSFSMSGSNLESGTLTVTAPTNFQVSKASGSGWASSITFTGVSGTLAATTVYVRLATGKSAGEYSGNVEITGCGLESAVQVAVSGTVYTPTITASPASVSWNTSVGVAPTTQSVMVTGTHLKGNISVALNGTDASSFSIGDVSSIAQATAEGAGGTITITYTGSYAATTTKTANIQLTASDATTVNVPITFNVITDPNLYFLTDLEDINPKDKVIIVATLNVSLGEELREYYALKNATTTSTYPPDAIDVEEMISSNKQTLSYSGTDLQWNINYNSVSGEFTINRDGDDDVFLYCIDNNKGLSVGTTGTYNTYVIDDDYIKCSSLTRYLGVYNSDDWRTYTSNGGNIADQTFTFYVQKSTDPYVTLGSSFTEFTYEYNHGPSVAQSFTVSGANLTANVVVTAPTNYEVSKNGSTGWGSSVAYEPTTGTVSEQTVYIRLAEGKTVGTYNYAAASGLAVTSTGADAVKAALSGSVTPESFTVTATSSNVSHGTVSPASESTTTNMTITASPLDGYRVVSGAGGYTVTTGTASVVNNGDNTFTVTPSTDCTVRINFEAIPTHKVTYWATGTKVQESEVREGAAIPDQTTETASEIEAYCGNRNHFVGWTTTPGYSHKTDAPEGMITTMSPGGTMSTSDVDYYAVFANTGGTSTSFSRVTSLSQLADGDVIVIVSGSSNQYILEQTSTGITAGGIQTATTSITNSNSAQQWTLEASGNDWKLCKDASNKLTTTPGYTAYGNTLTIENSYSENYFFIRSSGGTSYLEYYSGWKFWSTDNPSGNNGNIRNAIYKQDPGYIDYTTECCSLKPVEKVTINGKTNTSVTIEWTLPSTMTGITKFQVIDVDNGNNVVADDISTSATSATISDLTKCNTYHYKVVSYSDACSVSSSTVEAQPFGDVYTVTFNYHEGTGSPASFTTSCSGSSTTLPSATRDGYTFLGWWTAADGGSKVGDAGANYDVTATTTVHAHWTQNYSVTYSRAGGTAVCSDETCGAGLSYTVCSTEPTKSGYNFGGWSDGVNTYAAGATFTMPAANVTLTAQWTANWRNLTFNVPTGGGSITGGPAGSHVLDNHTFTFPTITGIASEKWCWTFLGWTETAPNGSGTWATTPSYIAGGATSSAITSDKTYYAVYSKTGAGASGTVELTTSDIQRLYTENVTGTENISYGTSHSVTATDGSVWTTTGQQTNGGKTYVQLTNADGVWFQLPTVGGAYRSITITHNTNSSQRTLAYRTTYAGSNVSTANTAASTSSPTTITIEEGGSTTGYIVNTSSYQYQIQSISASYGPPTEYAHILDDCPCVVTEFDLTYDANATNFPGSVISCENVTGYAWADHEEQYTFCSAPTLAGYRFLYWSENANGSGNHWNAGETVTCLPSADLTVYAYYERVYTVTFNNQGTPTPVTQGSAGAAIDVPAATTQCSAEWAFVGWSETAIAPMSLLPELEITAGTSTYTPDEDVTLYAIYRKTSTSSAFVAGMSGAYKIKATYNATDQYATDYNGAKLRYSATPGAAQTYYIKYVAADGGKYTIQQSDGQFIKYQGKPAGSGAHTDLALSATEYFWRINASGSLWAVQATTSTDVNTHYLQFDPNGSTGFKGYTNGINIAFVAADGQYYYRTMSCEDDFDIIFHNNGATINWADGHPEASYKDLTDGTVITTFPTASFDGWTFLGWRTADYEESTTAPVSSGVYGGTDGASGNTITVASANIDLYPVFTRFEDNEPFDQINGGDYYIYFLESGSNDGYGAEKRVYAAEYSSGKRYSSTALCSAATTFTFTKLDNGNWTIYDNTTKKYLYGVADDDLKQQASATGAEWTLTVHSGNEFDAFHVGTSYGQITAQGNGTSATFMNYSRGNISTNPIYHRVYLGSCTNRTFTTNPSTTPHVEIHGTVKVTSTNTQTVRANSVLSVMGSNLTTSTITVASSSADLLLSTSTNNTFTQSITIPVVSNQVEPTAVYVAYNPTETTDGINSTITVTVSDDPSAPAASASTTAGDIQGRHLPAAFVIAAKAGNAWLALPANMMTVATYDGIPVIVDNIDNPTAVTMAPKTVSYGLASVHNTRKDANGTALVFYSKVDGMSNRALYASHRTSDSDGESDESSENKIEDGLTKIRNRAQLTNASSAPYEWLPTTTDLVTYELTNTQRQSDGGNCKLTYSTSTTSHHKWGIYGSGETSITEVRLLPVTEVEDLELDVMEWNTTEIAVKSSTDITSGVKVAIGNNDLVAKTPESLGGDIYKISGLSLGSDPGKILRITNSAANKASFLNIPLIVTGEKTEANLRSYAAGGSGSDKLTEGKAIAKSIDVVIRNGGKLTTGTAQGTFKNLYVYPGGKLNVSQTLSVNQLYLRGGFSFLAEKTPANYLMPEAYIAANLTGSANIIYDFYIDNRYYYIFTLPYTVSLSNVHDETGSDDFKVWVKYYDGAQRASGAQETGWEYYSGDYFTAGVGYEIAAKPSVAGRPLAIVRFPLGNPALTSDGEGAKEEVTVDNYGYDAYMAGTQTANNVGWNFVGNPYMSTWKQTTDWGLSYMQIGSMQENTPDGEHWDGTYVWKDEPVRYVTILNLFAQEYSQKATSNYELPPFQPFFIQVKDHNASFSMSKDNRIAKAPAQMQNIQRDNERLIELILNSNLSQDNTGLLIGEDFSADYEMGDDLVKMTGNNQLAIYTQTGGYDLAFNALSEELAAQRIPVGFTAPADGEYSISINDNSDLRDVESVILTDYETGLEIDLMAEDYIFDAVAQKNNDHRFTLNIRMRNWRDIGTDIDGQHAVGQLDEVRVLRSSTGLVLRNVPLDATVYVYDMTGKLIGTYLPEQTYGQQTDVGHRVELNGLPIGVYNIRVQTATDGKTLRGINN